MKKEKDVVAAPTSCATPSNSSTDTPPTVVPTYSPDERSAEAGDVESMSPSNDTRIDVAPTRQRQRVSASTGEEGGGPWGETLPVPPPRSPGSMESLSLPPRPPLEGVAEGLAEGFLQWGVKYALENLARAQDNEVFPLVMEQLQVRGEQMGPFRTGRCGMRGLGAAAR